MAYFANGSEGMYLDEQCGECLHHNPDVGCPIAFVQMEFNYAQCKKGNGDLRRALTMLVDDKGNCKMKPLLDKYVSIPKDIQIPLFQAEHL